MEEITIQDVTDALAAAMQQAGADPDLEAILDEHVRPFAQQAAANAGHPDAYFDAMHELMDAIEDANPPIFTADQMEVVNETIHTIINEVAANAINGNAGNANANAANENNGNGNGNPGGAANTSSVKPPSEGMKGGSRRRARKTHRHKTHRRGRKARRHQSRRHRRR